MLTLFDWLRLCPRGYELIATLKCHAEMPGLFPEPDEEIGPPLSAFTAPCRRCWTYPVQKATDFGYCRTCMAVLSQSAFYKRATYRAALIWGAVNMLPHGIVQGKGFYAQKNVLRHIHDSTHFFLVLDRWQLREWIQDILLYHGHDIKGLIQVFPTCGETRLGHMGDVLTRVAHLDSRFPQDMLRFRFFSNTHQVFAPHVRDRQGILTFETMPFLAWLDRASIFKKLLRPNEQELFFEFMAIKDPAEKRFYWGRLIGFFSQEKRDIFNSWNFQQWSHDEAQLLKELTDYVDFKD